jgi:hypothetical protein
MMPAGKYPVGLIVARLREPRLESQELSIAQVCSGWVVTDP